MMNELQAMADMNQSINVKVLPGGWPRREADHRFLQHAVPATIGDQQAAMALLGFFERVDEAERISSSPPGWLNLLSQFSIVAGIAGLIRWSA